MSGVVGTPQVLSPDLMWSQDIDLSVSTSMKCFNLSSWTEQRQNISLLQILRLVRGKQSYSYYLLFSWSLKHKTHLDANSSSDQHFNSSWEKCFCWWLQLRRQWDNAVQHSEQSNCWLRVKKHQFIQVYSTRGWSESNKLFILWDGQKTVRLKKYLKNI